MEVLFEDDVEIACFECEEGYMHLEFDDVAVRMTKERFVEFSLMADRVREIIAEESSEQRLDEHQLLSLQ